MDVAWVVVALMLSRNWMVELEVERRPEEKVWRDDQVLAFAVFKERPEAPLERLVPFSCAVRTPEELVRPFPVKSVNLSELTVRPVVVNSVDVALVVVPLMTDKLVMEDEALEIKLPKLPRLVMVKALKVGESEVRMS